MTLEDIYHFFKDDTELLKYFDPQSHAKNNMDASIEIYNKLLDHVSDGGCTFKKVYDLGYIFYYKRKRLWFFEDKVLVSFCIKPEHRNKDSLVFFSEIIKLEIGKHFKCYLYNSNTRAIRFLEKMGMKKIKSTDLITLLHI